MSLGRAATCLLLGAAACAPATAPSPAPPTAASRARPRPTRPATAGTPPARAILVGQMCLTAAGGRPGVEPWFTRQISWSDQPDDLAAPIARGAARQFSVLGHDGRRVGLFSTIGLATVDEGAIAAGGYAGAAGCELVGGAPGARPTFDPGCAEVQRNCALAIAEVKVAGQAPVGEDPEALAPEVGGACVAGAALAVDVDGDGRAEAFPLAGLLDETSGPAEELLASEGGAAAPTCAARFSLPRLLPQAHPRGFLGLNLLGVVDLDGDGRREVIVQLRYAGRRSVALYTARESTSRLERVGETLVRSADREPALEEAPRPRLDQGLRKRTNRPAGKPGT